MAKYHPVEPDIENELNDIIESLAFPEGVKFKILGVEKQKTVFKLTKVPDLYAYISQHEFVLLVNTEFYDNLNGDSEDALRILLDEELNKASYDMDKGKAKAVKPDKPAAFLANIRKYGEVKVDRAKELEKNLAQQKQDATEDSKEATVVKGNSGNPFFQ